MGSFWRRVAAFAVMLLAGPAGCNGASGPETAADPATERPPAADAKAPASASAAAPAADADDARWAAERERMVADQLEARDVRDSRVLQAMRTVPRHLFVPADVRALAYGDHPLPIGFEQTISQPYVVGFMTEALAVRPGDKVLEVGTGSGYQAAVLSGLAARVFSIEIVDGLAARSKKTLDTLGYRNVQVRAGDGYRGWPEESPFDAIIVTCAPDHVPPALRDQLRVGGRLVIPVGEAWQELLQITRTESGFAEKRILPVRFVPMTGEAQSQGK